MDNDKKINSSFTDIRCVDITGYRSLTGSERETLLKNGNIAQSWDLVRVHEHFNPGFVWQCRFFGEIYIGALKEGFIEHQGLSLPFGLYNSTLINCSIGHFSSINSLHYCSNYDIGSEVIIHNTGEIRSDKSARFGNGAIINGEMPDQYRWMHLINENGGRKVLPFNTMTCSDAFIWAKNPHDQLLMERLRKMTSDLCLENIGCKGRIGHEAVIINVKSINNSWIDNFAVVDGAEKIDNCTIRSDDLESSIIGTGVILCDSIIGFGNQIQSGAQLQSVVTGCAVSVSQVSRISHSYIGDNSAIACCEIAHSLIFPSHGQHHNNSFLIAAMIGGQSNIAAGATIGSNHNSRMNDGEIWASRGFWPGLCTSFKHNSRFASYVMCVKGDYPCEIDIPFPFSVIINDPANDTLKIIPAYWFMYNMYSLMRSRYKFAKRDKRIHKDQIIEHDPLAPDTIEEIFKAIAILEQYAGRHWFKENNKNSVSSLECQNKGRELLQSGNYSPDHIELLDGTLQRGTRPVIIEKPAQAWKVYQDMICWYAVKTLTDYPDFNKFDIRKFMFRPRVKNWINCGGQIFRKEDLEELVSKVKSGIEIKSWQDIHQLYQKYQNNYETWKFHHAAATISSFISEDLPFEKQYKSLLNRASDIAKWIAQSVRAVRKKDYTDCFRTMVYGSADELQAVIGNIDEDTTIQNIENETEKFISLIKTTLTTD